MGRKPKHPKPSSITIYNKIFKRLEDSPIDIYFCYEKFKYSEELKRDKYIVHLIFINPLSVSKAKYLTEVLFKVVKLLKLENPSTNLNNSIVYSIFDLPKGVRFTPDFRMIDQIINYKDAEFDLNIKLGHIIGLFNKGNKRQLLIMSLVRKYLKNFPVYIVTELESAYSLIDSYKEIKDC